MFFHREQSLVAFVAQPVGRVNLAIGRCGHLMLALILAVLVLMVGAVAVVMMVVVVEAAADAPTSTTSSHARRPRTIRIYS